MLLIAAFAQALNALPLGRDDIFVQGRLIGIHLPATDESFQDGGFGCSVNRASTLKLLWQPIPLIPIIWLSSTRRALAVSRASLDISDGQHGG
jgi:hypothetical protein